MTSRIRVSADAPWYDLFSRGARDWLRHNQKVRQAVNERLLDLLAGGDFISNPTERTVRVPVRMLEHARFKLADPQSESGAGQGEGDVGDVLRPAKPGAGDESGVRAQRRERRGRGRDLRAAGWAAAGPGAGGAARAGAPARGAAGAAAPRCRC